MEKQQTERKEKELAIQSVSKRERKRTTMWLVMEWKLQNLEWIKQMQMVTSSELSTFSVDHRAEVREMGKATRCGHQCL